MKVSQICGTFVQIFEKNSENKSKPNLWQICNSLLRKILRTHAKRFVRIFQVKILRVLCYYSHEYSITMGNFQPLPLASENLKAIKMVQETNEEILVSQKKRGNHFS